MFLVTHVPVLIPAAFHCYVYQIKMTSFMNEVEGFWTENASKENNRYTSFWSSLEMQHLKWLVITLWCVLLYCAYICTFVGIKASDAMQLHQDVGTLVGWSESARN
jgi:hypothetical protein